MKYILIVLCYETLTIPAHNIRHGKKLNKNVDTNLNKVQRHWERNHPGYDNVERAAGCDLREVVREKCH